MQVCKLSMNATEIKVIIIQREGEPDCSMRINKGTLKVVENCVVQKRKFENSTNTLVKEKG